MSSRRFVIRVEGAFRRVSAVFGVREGSTFIDVGPDSISLKCGFVEAREIPRSAIASATIVPWPGRLRIGWRVRPGNTVWLVGANAQCVRLEFDPPQPFRFPPISWFARGAKALLVSVDDPAGLVAAVNA